MNYIVLDLEWNQGSCEPPPQDCDVPFEVIEIGAVKLNSDRVMIDEFSELVKPQIYDTMHYITGKLIHIKMKELAFERPFDTVIKQFLEWCGEDYIFCTWGPQDLTELQRNMKHYGIDSFNDGPLAYYDIQKLFAIEYCNDRKRRGLEKAIDFLEIEKDIPFHRAFSDAYYTAKVFAKIKRDETLRHYSYDLYSIPKDKKSELHLFFGDYDKYISRSFSSREALMADKEVKCSDCYICNKKSKRILKPFSPNGKYFLILSECERHGYVKTKIRIRKTDDDRYFTVKTRKIISKEAADDLLEREIKLKEYRKAKKKGS